jgi:hypothetical protein
MSWLTSIFSTNANNGRTGADLDAELLRVQQERADRMAREQSEAEAAEWLRQVELNRTREESAYNLDEEAEVDRAFVEGWNDAVNERRQQFGSAISLPFKLVPWQAVVIAAVVAFFWLGGPALLKRKVSKA